MRSSLLLLAAVLAVGGCAGPVRTVTDAFPQTTSTARLHLQDAAANGPVLLEVRDNPFGEDVAAPFALAASGSATGIPVRFTVDPAQAARPHLRIIVQFNPGPAVGAAEVCGAPRPAASRAAGGELTALVAFCRHFEPIVSVQAAAPPTDRADGPVIRALAHQVMVRMFDPDPTDRNGQSPSGSILRLRPAVR